MRWTILVGDRDVPYDGVVDHSQLLARELRANHDVTVLTRSLSGRWDVPDVHAALASADVVLLEYTPWNLGLGSRHWRFMTDWRRLRRSAPWARWLLFVHEVATPAPDDRLNRRVQQLQLAWIARRCHAVVGATSLMGGRSRRRVELPVGSNLPDGRDVRAAQREQLGLPADVFVVGSFLQDYRRAEAPLVTSAVAAAAAAHDGRTVHLALGSSPAATQVQGVDRLTPGALSSENLAAHLACADVYISPFSDGLSARRTSLVTALQHGLPVVTNAGPATEPWLPALGAVCLAPATEAGFATAASQLVSDVAGRKQLAHRARAAFEEHFDWPVLVAALEGVASGVSQPRSTG